MYDVLILPAVYTGFAGFFYECSPHLDRRRRKRKRNHASAPLAETNVRGYRCRLLYFDKRKTMRGSETASTRRLRAGKYLARQTVIKVQYARMRFFFFKSPTICEATGLSPSMQKRKRATSVVSLN